MNIAIIGFGHLGKDLIKNIDKKYFENIYVTNSRVDNSFVVKNSHIFLICLHKQETEEFLHEYENELTNKIVFIANHQVQNIPRLGYRFTSGANSNSHDLVYVEHTSSVDEVCLSKIFHQYILVKPDKFQHHVKLVLLRGILPKLLSRHIQEKSTVIAMLQAVIEDVENKKQEETFKNATRSFSKDSISWKFYKKVSDWLRSTI